MHSFTSSADDGINFESATPILSHGQKRSPDFKRRSAKEHLRVITTLLSGYINYWDYTSVCYLSLSCGKSLIVVAVMNDITFCCSNNMATILNNRLIYVYGLCLFLTVHVRFYIIPNYYVIVYIKIKSSM